MWKLIKNYHFLNKSIKITLKKRFRKHFLGDGLFFLIYEHQIISVALFLYISSAYLYRKKKEKYFFYDWQSQLRIFSAQQLSDFLICSVKYLIETGRIQKNKTEILKSLKQVDKSFKEEYLFSLIKKNTANYTVDENIDFSKYMKMIDQSLKISCINQQLKNKPELVINLIAITSKWKGLLFEVFGNKSEYIVYTFFLNLNL